MFTSMLTIAAPEEKYHNVNKQQLQVSQILLPSDRQFKKYNYYLIV